MNVNTYKLIDFSSELKFQHHFDILFKKIFSAIEYISFISMLSDMEKVILTLSTDNTTLLTQFICLSIGYNNVILSKLLKVNYEWYFILCTGYLYSKMQ